MEQRSRVVTSSQTGVHPRLARLVERHRRQPWRKPPQAVDEPALASLTRLLQEHRGPLVLDSFCGTGMSTALLAQRHPDALVIGVDQSAHRLARHPELPDNARLLQAHCEAVWRHLAEQGRRLSHHYLLYPNPWPKPGHVSRRIHGHPAFPLLPSLGGQVEVRSNWQLYVEEFGVALLQLGIPARVQCIAADAPPITRFEHKYRESGQDLWCLQAKLPDAGGPGHLEKTDFALTN